VDVVVEGKEIQPRPAPEIENNLFRIVQEVLTNIGKHARAGCARILIEAAGGVLRLAISDDGVGFDPTGAQKAGEGTAGGS
jgi:signal transduction histidine kinase